MAIIDVIRYEAKPSEIVGKYESDDIKLGSQLIVYPAQTAFFVKGGQILDEFKAGQYTLKTDNIPLLNKIVNLPFGSRSPFPAEVWFVNQGAILDCKWGTSSPIQIDDPKYNVIIPASAYGQYGIKITNPKVFLERLVGNMPAFSTSRVTNYFNGLVVSRLTNIVADSLRGTEMSVIELNAHLTQLSEFAKNSLKDLFAEYGIEIPMFTIMNIKVAEQDISYINLKKTKDKTAEIDIMGEDKYRLMRGFNVLESAASNQGGGMMGSAVGIGAGLAIGQKVGQMANEMLGDTNGGIQDTPPPIPIVKYFLAIDGKRKGPFTVQEIEKKLIQDRVTSSTLCWTNGMETWTPLKDVEDFKAFIDNNVPPPIPL